MLDNHVTSTQIQEFFYKLFCYQHFVTNIYGCDTQPNLITYVSIQQHFSISLDLDPSSWIYKKPKQTVQNNMRMNALNSYSSCYILHNHKFYFQNTRINVTQKHTID